VNYFDCFLKLSSLISSLKISDWFSQSTNFSNLFLFCSHSWHEAEERQRDGEREKKLCKDFAQGRRVGPYCSPIAWSQYLTSLGTPLLLLLGTLGSDDHGARLQALLFSLYQTLASGEWRQFERTNSPWANTLGRLCSSPAGKFELLGFHVRNSGLKIRAFIYFDKMILLTPILKLS